MVRASTSLVHVPAPARPLLAVDAPSLMYRAFFALPQSITDDGGRPVNALLGMAIAIGDALRQREERAVQQRRGVDDEQRAGHGPTG